MPLANSALTDVGQPSHMTVPRARLTALETSHRKNWCSRSCMEYLSTHIKTDCWTSSSGSLGILHCINHMRFYMRGTCGNLSVNLNSCVRILPSCFLLHSPSDWSKEMFIFRVFFTSENLKGEKKGRSFQLFITVYIFALL